MKKALTILVAVVMLLSLAACDGNNSPTNTPSTPAQQEAETSTSTATPAGFSQQELQEIDAQLQGTWTVNAEGAESVYVFSDGNVTVEPVASGVSGGVNTGSSELGNDSLGSGLLSVSFDNGVEGDLILHT